MNIDLWTIVVITPQIIALIAMVFARRASARACAASELASVEASKALRSIDNVLSSRSATRTASIDDLLSSCNFNHEDILL